MLRLNLKLNLKSNLKLAFILSTLIFACILAGCSSAEKNTEMDQRAKLQTPPANMEQVADKAAYTFANMPGLSDVQREKLRAVYSRTYMEAVTIRTEIGQSKLLLFDTISSKDYKSSDVKHLKKKIKALDEKRLEVMFQALDDVQQIIGYGADKVPFYKHFQENEYPDPGRAYR